MVKIQKLFLFVILLLMYACGNNINKKRIFNRQLGTYVLDMSRTSLGAYAVDSVKYKQLRITFYSDSTFTMNMMVPFMHDSIGTWVAGEGSAYDYNQLYYKNIVYSMKELGEQFYPPYERGSDTIFLLNSATPRKGFDYIKEIYFIKIGR
jgi:hypothetical protein